MLNEDFEQKIEECCDQYAAELRSGGSPDVLACLAEFDTEHQARLLRELLSLEITLRGLERMEGKEEYYCKQLPQFAVLIRECFSSGTANDFETLVNLTGHKGGSEGLPSPSNRIGNYKLLQTIGEGGMGVVWMAEQLHPIKRRVAIKIVKRGIASQEVIARFEAERQALAMMDHPGIARIFDAGTNESGQPYFAMELVKGLTLTEYCDAHRLKLRERLQLFVQVCEAVQHAHQKGILHRDLKPSNILVAEYNGKPQPKVIDFGLAKALESSQQLTDKSLFTEFGQVLGTLKYMSPEQAGLDSLDIDTRADIYALGVILYELLTGTTPLDTDTLKGQAILKVLELVREQESPRPSMRLITTRKNLLASITSKRQTDTRNLSTALSGDLDWIVMKSLEKDRNRRYETAVGFGRDVARYLDNQPVEARPPSSAYRLKKLYLRNRLAVTSAIALTAAIALGLIGTIWFAIDAGIARGQAEQRQNEAELALSREREVSLELVQLAEQLADNYLNAGDRVQALPLFQKALEKSELTLGPESPSTLEQMHSVAFLLGLDGRIEEALPIQQKVMDATIRVLGLEAPETHSAISNLAANYLRIGQVPKAVELFEKVYKLRSTHLDRDDFALRISLRWMVISYSMAERWPEALPIAEQWLEHLQRVQEAESPEFAWATASVAAIHCGMRNYDEAKFYAQRVATLSGTTPADQYRANNILARCSAHDDLSHSGLSEETIRNLGESYAELKALLEELPGFKQFFVTNACKRNLDAFKQAGDQQMSRIWLNELEEIEASIRENRKPTHPGIPTFDPATGTEKELYAPSDKSNTSPVTKEFSAEDD